MKVPDLPHQEQMSAKRIDTIVISLVALLRSSRENQFDE